MEYIKITLPHYLNLLVRKIFSNNTQIMSTISAPTQIPEGLTYDDVLLIPQRSAVRSRKQVSTTTRLSRHITLDIPVVASNMDTVCEDKMAVAIAREGGIGILHRFCNVTEQCSMVKKVKRAQSFLIDHPRMILPTDTKLTA